MEQTWGKWMRVEQVTDWHAGTGEPKRSFEVVINLDHVTRITPFASGTAFVMADGDHVNTTTDFEVACAALMISQGPRPPMTRAELASESDVRTGKSWLSVIHAAKELVKAECAICGQGEGSMFHALSEGGHSFEECAPIFIGEFQGR